MRMPSCSRVLLNFRFRQIIHAIRLVRGTKPSGSSVALIFELVFLGLLDRFPEPFLFQLPYAWRERSLKKSSVGDSELD